MSERLWLEGFIPFSVSCSFPEGGEGLRSGQPFRGSMLPGELVRRPGNWVGAREGSLRKWGGGVTQEEERDQDGFFYGELRIKSELSLP